MWWLMMFLSTIIIAVVMYVVVDTSWITLLAVAITTAVTCAFINWLEKRRGNRWW